MSKKKKIVIGCSIGAAAAALILVFVLDIFGLYVDSYRFDTSKYISVGQYKGLTYTKNKVSVNNKEVKAQIKSQVNAKSKTKTVKKGTVKDGDAVNISYVGKINGKTFSGGSESNVKVTIGKTKMLSGFTDGLIGNEVGDSVTLHLKYPKKYKDSQVAGKSVVFKVKINSLEVTSTPEYNLAWVKKYTKYNSISDYEDSVKAKLLTEKKQNADNAAKSDLWAAVISKSKVKKYPARQVNYEAKRITEKYKEQAGKSNVSWNKYLKTYMQMSQASFDKLAKSYARKVVKEKLVLHYIAEKENIEVTNKQYDEYLKDTLKSTGLTEESFKKNYGEDLKTYAKENDFKASLLLNKVTAKIMEYGKAKN